MDYIVASLKNMSDEEAREYIEMLFDGYNQRKKEKRLFESSLEVPKVIILTYYACVKKPPFKNIFENFKKKYITEDSAKNFKERYLYNENKLEEVHTKEEQQGLRLVYDYIQKKDTFDDVNIYTLSTIHEILYSKAPYPEFGGQYRKDERYLPNTGIDITSPSLIVREMNMLRNEVSELVSEGIELGKKIDSKKVIDYIDKCVELKCKLIKIHPFGDGNGRSIRAFINLLFRLANLPPVYIENKERQKYGEAMQTALGDEDLSKIKGFYYYKICDSIISLDISLNKNERLKFSDDAKKVEKKKGIN